MSWDIHQGQDACDPQGFGAEETFDFIWAHPPYYRQKLYADDARDLSDHHARSFPAAIRPVHRNCAGALKRGGKLAILMGDYSDHEAGFVPLTSTTPNDLPSPPD